jgi:hypothetical protein
VSPESRPLDGQVELALVSRPSEAFVLVEGGAFYNAQRVRTDRTRSSSSGSSMSTTA